MWRWSASSRSAGPTRGLCFAPGCSPPPTPWRWATWRRRNSLMELKLRKPLIILLLLFGAGWYIAATYTLKDALAFSHKKMDPQWGPMIDYYVGMGYYTRSEYDPAVNAFNQLLTDFPTTQY